MKYIHRAFFAVLLAGFILFSVASVRGGDLFFQIKKQLTIFSDVYKEVATQYVDEVSPEAVMKRSIDAMLELLDPYTAFIDEGEQQQMEILSSGSYGGIGIDAGFSGDRIVIIAPLEGYPAQRAGMRPGDIIEEVNGVDVRGFSPEEVQQLTIGDIGTTVQFKIRRPGIDQSIDFELERERIEVKNIHFADLIGDDENFGYIQLSRFGQRTAEEVRAKLMELNNRKELAGLILDLRNNPGGLLNEAVELVDKFIEPGVTVVETRGRMESQSSAFVSDEPALFEDLPVVVLMNNGSASASEVVAGAFQDLDRAVIIGENSFGKGLVQTIRPLSYNTSLKITISKYYTPSGRSIQSVDYARQSLSGDGVTPDSLRRAFRTKNGRTVFDGKGIEPDIILNAAESSLLELSLLRNNEYFFFINKLQAELNGDVSAEIPADLFNRFTRHLVESGFEYRTPVDQHIEAISENLENFSKPSSAGENLEELKALLRDFKISEIYTNQEMIERNLKLEWVSQSQGAAARQKAMFEFDDQIRKAVELLSNAYQYQSILTP